MDIQYRATIRGQVTKLVKSIEDYLQKLPQSVAATEKILEDLEIFLFKIQSFQASLRSADSAIRENIEESKYTNECNTIIEYDDKIFEAVARLQHHINAQRKRLNTVTSTSTNSDLTNGSNSSSMVSTNLKRLQLKTFNGNFDQWIPFWEQFKRAVHLNADLDGATKFSYLQAQIIGKAADSISGLTASELCYNEAIELLNEEYGNSDRLIDKYIGQLMSTPAIRSKNDAIGMRKLYNSVTATMRSLYSLNVFPSQYNIILKSLIIRALPSEVRAEFYRIEHFMDEECTSPPITNNRTMQSTALETTTTNAIQCDAQIKRIMSFLKREVEALEKAMVTMCDKRSDVSHHNILNRTATGLFTASKINNCFFCSSKAHATAECDSKHLTLKQRKEKLRDNRRCFRCTQPKHSSKYCKSKSIKCRQCNGRHVTSMCDPTFSSKPNHGSGITATYSNRPSVNDSVLQNNSVSLTSFNRESIFLQTACAFAYHDANNQKYIRAILDSASQRTFIREDVSKVLNLPVVGLVSMSILPFGTGEITERRLYRCVEVKLRSHFSEECLTIKAIEVPQICMDVLPAPDINHPKLKEFILADAPVPGITLIDGICLLIGADYYWSIVTGQREMVTDRLALVATEFGWTLHGPSASNKSSEESGMALFINSVDVENFWKLEAIGIFNENKFTSHFTEKFLEENVTGTGKRFEVKLPWKANDFKINDNYFGALVRLKSLTQRLLKDTPKLIEYDALIWDMINSGIVEPASNEVGITHYLPHRAVYRDEKSTTKVRIVFDASAHLPGHKSLNDHLCQGPNLLQDLLSILLNFRVGQVGIVADIEKAFLQISLADSDRNSHRFLWYGKPLVPGRNLPPIKAYRMTRVTFGVNCSPFLLNAVITKHLKNCQERYATTCEVLSKQFYVDDLVTSLQDANAAQGLYKEAKLIMSEISMNLRKWNSNSDELRQLFNKRCDNGYVDDIQKVLGITWCTITDEIKIDFSSIKAFVLKSFNGTKRSVLQALSRIYDPLGILGPFTLRVKILMQSIWKLKPGWDDILPNDILAEWEGWRSEVTDLEDFSIQRCALNPITTDNVEDIELHVFADASPKAFGAVAYVRHRKKNGEFSVNLLVSKNRIAPLNANNGNELSLPKLELTAALIATRLKAFIEGNTEFKFHTTYLWSDSCIALCWIRGFPHKKWQQYVDNRVNEILRFSTKSQWLHCPGNENPADLITRGIHAKALVYSELWKYGPSWLSESQHCWPLQTTLESSIVNIALSVSVSTIELAYETPILSIEKFSSLHRLLRITAYIFRLIHNAKNRNGQLQGDLSADEIKGAQIYWIHIEQYRYFPNEIAMLKSEKLLDSHSKILKLNPFLDENAVLRLGGRLQEINDETNVAHPIILSKSSYLSSLLALQAHKDTHHGGTNVVLSRLRKHFWIIQGRVIAKKAAKGCYACRRLFGKPASQPFAPLPRDRLTLVRPFDVTGVDFAGPLYVKQSPDGQPIKVYLMLFTCASVRALHLELVPTLTTESCLSAIRRFIGRRGVPKVMYSDNAKTFKRVDYEIEQLYKQINAKQITSFASHYGIRWKYIVERAPWWGGWWERLVRTVKNALKVTIGRANLTFEQLETVIVEVEATVNSRPLTYISDDPQDFQPLTPSSLLLGPASTLFPHLLPATTSMNRGKLNLLWKQRQQFVNRFQQRWIAEYLHQLRSAHYTSDCPSTNLKPGNVVIVANDKSRLLWQLGMISTVFQGRDGKIRSCEIKLSDGRKLRRPVQLLYPLEVQN